MIADDFVLCELLSYDLAPLLNSLHRRQLASQFFRQITGNLVGADTDGLAHVLEGILCHEVVLALAEQQTNTVGAP